MSKLPKHIRNGVKQDQLKTFIDNLIPRLRSEFKKENLVTSMIIRSFDFSRDCCGNRTCHFNVSFMLEDRETMKTIYECNIVESGFYREQFGYSNINDAAVHALTKLGYEFIEPKFKWDEGFAQIPITNIL